MNQDTTPDTTDDSSDTLEVPDRVQIIDETPHSLLVRVKTDGGWEMMNKAATTRNVLLFRHGLWSLVNGDGEEVLQYDRHGETAQIVSTEDNGTYRITVGDQPMITVGAQYEERLLSAVQDLQQDPEKTLGDLVTLYQYVLDNQVRRGVISKLLEVNPFKAFVERGTIEEDSRGWLIHDELLLTWECDFRNDNGRQSYRYGGSGVRPVESENDAFEMSSFSHEMDDNPVVEFADGTETFGEQEVEFVAHAIWALKNISDLR